MADKLKTTLVCQSCGTHHPKHQGRCNGCGEWNTLVEEVQEPQAKRAETWRRAPHEKPRPLALAEVVSEQQLRLPLPDAELNRVLDGGLVPGSLLLLAGEPGIGKSTLLLQTALRMTPHRVLYVSGEESAQQVKMRAERLACHNPELFLFAETNLDAVLRHARELAPALLVLDSVQTLYTHDVESAPGSVAQVRECTARILRFAKESRVPAWLVGHITKEGSIAGPKVLEHMVDTVLEFEGDRHASYRIVRSVKNRFGATPELGIYEMRAGGLHEVANPSEIFLSDRAGGSLPGVAVGPTLQGARTLMVEVQALVSRASYATPQRSATGLDGRRLNMLLAVLEKKCGFRLGDQDVFLNLVGGLRLDDPALDLALAVAIVSSLHDLPAPPDMAFAAEVGLTGEVRTIVRLESRMAEAAKLGFGRLVVAPAAARALHPPIGLNLLPVRTLQDALEEAFG